MIYTVLILSAENDLNFRRCGKLGLYGTVGLAFKADFNESVRGGNCSFGIFKVSERRAYKHLFAALFKRFDAENVFHEERCRTACPTVAKAVAVALVAITSEIAVNIGFLRIFGQYLIEFGAVLCPVDVKIFPERRCAEVEHSAPIFAHAVKRKVNSVGLSERFEYVIAEERRKSVNAVFAEKFVKRFIRIDKPRKNLKRQCLFKSVMRINVLFELFGAKVCKIRFFLVRKCVEDFLASLANQAEKCMNARSLSLK